MKKQSCVATLATIVATILMASGAAAIGQEAPSKTPPAGKHSQGNMPAHQRGMMDMSAMKNEPHHVLAMAYRDNLVRFGTALRDHAASAKGVNREFARDAVAEMKRSFEQMQQHHQDHMKTMDDKMKTSMAGMMKQMDARQSAIHEHLAALDKEVQNSAPDAKSISKDVAEVLKQCAGMSSMHAGPMEHKMAGSMSHQMD